MRTGILVLVGLIACTRRAPSPPLVVAVGVPTASAAPVTVVKPAWPLTRLPQDYETAVLLANGHVFMTMKDVAWDWDPARSGPLRRVSLGDAGPAHTFSFVPFGRPRFIVARSDEEDVVAFDLWDAVHLTKIRTVEGTFVAETPVADVSQDGSRFIVLGCSAPREEQSDCEVGVFAMADGSLVHRTKLGRRTFRERPTVELSPTGAYFAISGDAPTEAYDANTGALLFRAAGARERVIGKGPERFAFTDDRHLLTTGENGGKLVVTDLAAKRTTATADSKITANEVGYVDGLSPDRMRVATMIFPNDGRTSTELVLEVFAFDRKRSSRIVVPNFNCAESCLTWIGPTTLLAKGTETFHSSEPRRIRIDTETRTVVDDPSPPPFFAFHEVDGRDFDRYGAALTKWHEASGALVTPTGARVDLGSIDTEASFSAVGDRFLIDERAGLKVLFPDGAIATFPR